MAMRSAGKRENSRDGEPVEPDRDQCPQVASQQTGLGRTTQNTRPSHRHTGPTEPEEGLKRFFLRRSNPISPCSQRPRRDLAAEDGAAAPPRRTPPPRRRLRRRRAGRSLHLQGGSEGQWPPRSLVPQISGPAAVVVSDLMADSLLLSRCRLI